MEGVEAYAVFTEEGGVLVEFFHGELFQVECFLYLKLQFVD